MPKELNVAFILSTHLHLTEEDLQKYIYITRTGRLHIRVHNNRPDEATHPGLLDGQPVTGLLKRLKGDYTNILDRRIDYKTTNTYIDALLAETASISSLSSKSNQYNSNKGIIL